MLRVVRAGIFFLSGRGDTLRASESGEKRFLGRWSGSVLEKGRSTLEKTWVFSSRKRRRIGAQKRGKRKKVRKALQQESGEYVLLEKGKRQNDKKEGDSLQKGGNGKHI